MDGCYNSYDFNDLLIFSQVVEHHGFTGAAKALGVARSKVCRNIAGLEERLGVRLVQRDTRSFRVTDIGHQFNEYCVRAVAHARAAFERIAVAKEAPSGWVRIVCPPLLGKLVVSPLIPKFVEKNPHVRIALELTDREVNIVDKSDYFDLCIRMRQVPSEDSALVMRSLGIVQQVLVASPGLLTRQGRPISPSQAAALPTLSWGAIPGPHVWRLVDQNEQELSIRHEPLMVADEIGMIRQAAIDGLGIAQLPLFACVSDIQHGHLEVILPEFPAPLCEIQVVFASKRGLLPAVRSFIDFLATRSVSEVPEGHIRRHKGDGLRANARFWTSREPLRRLAATG